MLHNSINICSHFLFSIYCVHELKEYATIYTRMAYLTPSPFRIKADRIYSLVQTLLLKLVRTPLKVYFTAFKSIFLSLSLCTYYLVWMSCLISFERCQSSCEEHGTSEHYKKFLSMVGFEPPTPHPLISSVSF